MKAQISLEYLLVASIAIAVISALFYYGMIYSSETTTFYQAQDTVSSIAKAVDVVYALGPGSSTQISVIIPENVVESSVGNNTILLKVESSAGINDVIAVTKANVTGEIPITPGRYFLTLNMTGAEVEISVSR